MIAFLFFLFNVDAAGNLKTLSSAPFPEFYYLNASVYPYFSLPLPFIPAYFGGSIIGNTNDSSNFFVGRAILPSPDLEACTELDPVSYDGTPYEGNVVVISGSACSFATMQANLMKVNATVILIAATIDPRPVFSCSGGYCPIPFILSPALDVLYNISRWAYSGFDVEISIPGTGPMQPDELEEIVTLVRETNFSDADNNLAGGLRGWADLLNDSTVGDPCLDRITGMWCIDGRVTEFRVNIEGLLPPRIGNFTQLRRLKTYAYTDIGTGPVPCDIGKLTNLKFFDLANNYFNALPMADECWINLTQIEWFDLSNGYFEELPPALSELTKIGYFDIGYNYFTSLIDLTNFTKLYYFSAPGNLISTPIPSFTNFSKLVYIDLSLNNLSIPLVGDEFNSMPNLQILDLSQNQIGGALPLFNGTERLIYFDFSYNQFNSSFPETWHLRQIQALYGSHNELKSPLTNLYQMMNLSDLDLSYNQLNQSDQFGGNSVGSFLGFLPASIVKANFEHNNLSGPWEPGFFYFHDNLLKLKLAHNKIESVSYELWGPNGGIEYLDLSFNNLSGSLPLALPSKNTQLAYFHGNPNFSSSSLPSYVIQTTPLLKNNINDTYNCLSIVGVETIAPDLTITLDPTYYNYSGCVCQQGTFGIPPNCEYIPSQTDLSQINKNQTLTFTDSAYGNQRLQTGVFTSWTTKRDYDVQAIRTIQFRIEVNTTYFRDFDDVLSIYEGDSDLSGERIFFVRGSNLSIPLRPTDSFQNNTFVVNIFAPVATLNFQSRDLAGDHFSSNVTFIDSCPAGFVTFQSTRCRQLEKFPYSEPLIIIVYAVVAVCLICILVIAVIVFRNRKLIIIKAASPIFCALTLFGLSLMAVGAVFHAISPDSGRWVCDLRTWFLALSIVVVLANLIVKANRIKDIFVVTKIVSAPPRHVTNKRLLQWALAMVAVELVLLIVFSGASFSLPQLVAGNGSTRDVFVELYQCSTSGIGFTVWFCIQMIYVGLFIVWSAYVAFLTKETPTAFNESSHILGALLELLFFLFVMVPLNFITEDAPNSLLLIRGLGQSFGALTLTLVLFGPKIYYIVIGRGDDRSMINTTNMQWSSGQSRSEMDGPSRAPSRIQLSRVQTGLDGSRRSNIEIGGVHTGQNSPGASALSQSGREFPRLERDDSQRESFSPISIEPRTSRKAAQPGERRGSTVIETREDAP